MHFNLGTYVQNSQGDQVMTVALPTIIRTTGDGDVDRFPFLIELARQSITAGAGLLFIDGERVDTTWPALASAAMAAKRLHACDAPEQGMLPEAGYFESIAGRNGIVCFTLPSPSAADAQLKTMTAIVHLFAEMNRIIASRTLTSPPLVLVLAGVLSLIGGVPFELTQIVARADAANITLVISDSDATAITRQINQTSLSRHPECPPNPAFLGRGYLVFHRTAEAETLQFYKRVGGQGDLWDGLDTGEARVVRCGSPSTSVMPVKLTREYFPDSECLFLTGNRANTGDRTAIPAVPFIEKKAQGTSMSDTEILIAEQAKTLAAQAQTLASQGQMLDELKKQNEALAREAASQKRAAEEREARILQLEEYFKDLGIKLAVVDDASIWWSMAKKLIAVSVDMNENQHTELFANAQQRTFATMTALAAVGK